MTSPMPPAPVEVRLENFEGPLDLLLHLIKKNDLDIYDIPISQITQEYLAYLDLLQELNLEMAGEYLVMATTLMEIKAHTLLPSAPEAPEGPDPRDALTQKLLEYQKYKEAAKRMEIDYEAAKDIFYRKAPPRFAEEEYALEASVFDLLEGFRKVLAEASEEVGEILYEEIPLEAKIREILDVLAQKASLTLEELFGYERRRRGLIVIFLALLELIRLKQVSARQATLFGEIRIFRNDYN